MRTEPENTASPFSAIQLIKLIGEGAYGVVSYAIATQADGTTQDVALKQIDIPRADRGGSVEQGFEEEARILSILDHPNIVRCYGRWQFPEAASSASIPAPYSHAIVLEYLALGSLEGLLKASRLRHPLLWDQRIHIAKDMSQGLAYLHNEQNMMHLDLKSANVLLDLADDGTRYQAKLADFGLTKTRQGTTRSLTMGEMKGTPRWMAPEIMAARPTYSKAADIYALGIILWELATLEVPFKEANMWGLMMSVREGERETIPEKTPECFGRLIERSWAQEWTERPTISEILAEIEAHEVVWSAFDSMQQTTEEHAKLSEENPALRLAVQGLQEQLTHQTTAEQRVQARVQALEAQLANERGEREDAQRRIEKVERQLAEKTEQLTQAEANLRDILEQQPSPPYTGTMNTAGLFSGAGSAGGRGVPLAVDPADVETFLTLVVRGQQTEAQVMLEKTPALSCSYGNVTDLSERRFEGITGFQYALWAQDWYMWRMIQGYLPAGALREQCEVFVTETAPWMAEHGRMFDLQPLINALKTYVEHDSEWSRDKREAYWCKTIGGLQRQLPVHVVNEYCRPDRAFDPIPDFRDPTDLPRQGYVHIDGVEYGVDWWFASENHWNVARRGRKRRGISALPLEEIRAETTILAGARGGRGPGGWRAMGADARSLDLLSTTRRQQVEALVDSLRLSAGVEGVRIGLV